MKSELKRLFPRATMTLLVMLLTTVSAWADYSWTSGGCDVTLSGGTLTVSKSASGNGAMADYNSPSDRPWHSYSVNITSVVIESGVTHIGNYAFYCCYNAGFTSITIPASVESIGNSAFISCSNLASITFAEGSLLTTINLQAFSGTAISSITIPARVTSIGSNVFGNCQNLTSINVDANNTNYASEGGVLFNNGKTTLIRYPIGKSGTAYTIPTGVEFIDNNAFDFCINLTSITIPASVTSIGNYAFYGCTNLATANVYAPSCTLGTDAFINCHSLSHIYVPSAKVTYYKDAANWSTYSGKIEAIPNFGYCGTIGHESDVTWELTGPVDNYTLTIMKVGTTGAMADYANSNSQPWKDYRSNITSVVIESGVTHIGNYAFRECKNAGFTSITIPASVQSIGEDAFSSCTGVKTVTFAPNSQLTSIGNYAFYCCDNAEFTSITIPASVESIGNSAFISCSKLASITFAEGSHLTTINLQAFSGTAISSITIPASVTSIGSNVFGNCQNLTSINVDANNTNYASEGGVLFNNGKTTLIRYPIGKSGTAYTIPTGVEFIDNNAFDSCIGLTSITIPASVTSIGNYAFYGCSNLATVTFAAGSQLTSIGDLAFYYCNNSLNTITIPASVQTIGSNAFNSCSNLATVTFATGSQLTTIENSAFDKCSALTAFTVPSGVTSIGDGAFSNCSSLATINVEAGNTSFSSDGGVLFNYDKTILIQYPIGNSRTAYTIPGGVRTIGSHAFYLNNNLTSVTIATSVQTICDNAFYGCPNLATVAFAPCSQLESIGVNAFRYCTLSSVTIPASVTSIRERAFAYCNLLTSVTIYAPWLKTYGLNAFESNGSDRKIYVISDRVSTYKDSWSAYASAIEDIPALAVNDAGGTLGKWTTYYNGLTDVTVADGTTIYKATYDKSANNVTLTPVSSNIIKMGEAVLLKSENDIVLSSAGGGSGDYTGNDLHGVDYATPLTDLGSSTDTYYVLSNKNGHFGFHKYTGTNMPANKAFLRISGDGNALAPSIDLYIDNNATGIENVQSSKLNVQCDNAWYTLDGRKLNAQPTKKGLYIVNGKKVVIK